uniref:X-ray repair cross-complementing protein 5 n=1 Tax=Cacopsylla melanoneura TaxID=428564 RepID=A0A8D8RKD6_9HEMI
MPPKKQKPKNLLILLVDVGPSNKDFEQGKACAFNIYKGKLFKEKSLDEIGLVIIGSEESENSSDISHISVAIQPAPASFPNLKAIHNLEQSSGVWTGGDWVQGLTVACDLLEQHSAGNAYNKIGFIVISSFESNVELSPLANIQKTINQYGVDVVCITSTDVSSTPLSNLSNVEITSIDQCLSETQFTPKEERNAMAWNVDFLIGDMAIPVTGYKWVGKEYTGNLWTAVMKSKQELVMSTREYKIRTDPSLPALEVDQLVRGYHYGNTIIPMTDDERKAMKYESGERGLRLICFTRKGNIPLYVLQDDTVYVITASAKSTNNSLLLSLIRQLSEEDLVCIVRQVYNRNNAPTIQVLYPVVEEDEEQEEEEESKKKYYFIMVRLPYAQFMNNISVPEVAQFSSYYNKTQDDFSSQELNSMQAYVEQLNLTKAAEYADDIPYLPEVTRDPSIQVRTWAQIRKYVSGSPANSQREEPAILSGGGDVKADLVDPSSIPEAIRALYSPSSKVEDGGRELRDVFGELAESVEIEE